MIRINTRTLDAEIVKGNTASFSVRPKINGEYALQEGDELWFTLRKVKDNQKLIQKCITNFDEGKADISLSVAETDSLEEGNYIYDLVMVRSDGSVDSLIPEGRDYAYFSVKKGVK